MLLLEYTQVAYHITSSTQVFIVAATVVVVLVVVVFGSTTQDIHLQCSCAPPASLLVAVPILPKLDQPSRVLRRFLGFVGRMSCISSALVGG